MNEFIKKSVVCSIAGLVIAACDRPPSAAVAELDPSSPVIADLIANGGYNQQLCVTAQLILTNSDGDDFAIVVDRARGSRFNMEQMATDPATKQVTVASLVQTVDEERHHDQSPTPVQGNRAFASGAVHAKTSSVPARAG